jgi:hypothetical protein
MSQTNGITKHQAIALSMPFVSLPVMELLKHTINSSKVENNEKKKLIELLDKNIKVAPGASCYEMINKEEKRKIEIYLSLEDRNFDINGEIKKVVEDAKLTKTDCAELFKKAGDIASCMNIYYEAILEKVPDIFARIKKTLKHPDEHAFDGIYITKEERKGYFIEDTEKMLCIRFKFSTIVD